MKNSLSVFQDHLIDYAGLFPPANLSLDTAIKNYANDKNGENSWMLGPFVLPVLQLTNLDSYLNLFSDEKPLTLSVVGRRSLSETECINQFREDINQIIAFVDQHRTRVKVNMLEIPLPPEVPSLELLEEIANEASKLNVQAFCEVLLTNDWKAHVTKSLDRIAAHNSSSEPSIGVKLRTGGIKADMFPSTEQVAFFLASCRDRHLPAKFTAGLHHPVRMYRDEVQTRMHGFLNIFIAGMLAHTEMLDVNKIEEILVDENPKSFSFSEDSLKWQDLSINAQEIKELRKKSLLSFGSCSFDEPRTELKELDEQQGVIL